jgi:hypothetical protein
MKKFWMGACFGVVFVWCGVLSTSACTPAMRQIAKTVIDAALANCIAANPDVEDEPALREICPWAEDAVPLVKDLLAARRKGAAKHAAKMSAANPACAATDAGK